MTSQTTPRYGFSLSLMVAALVAIAIAGSFWTKANGKAMESDNVMMNVGALMTTIDVASLPINQVEQPF